MSSRKNICVIGAGASGLCSIKAAKEENLDITCYEMSNFIGGLWKYRDEDEEKLASVTRSTIINSSKEMSAYSDYCPGSEFPNYMHNSLMHSYFESYAKKFDLKKFIKFRHEVLEVIQAKDYDETGNWDVKVIDLNTKQQKTTTFNAVMVCSGHHVKPLSATFKGQEKFKGKIIHTHSYKTPHKFEGDRCVVVGIGNSGGDAAVELSMFAKKVYLSTRRGAWVLWRVGPGGMPFDAMYIRRFWFACMNFFPYWLTCNVVQTYLNLRFNHKAYGIQPNHYVLSQHPMVNDALPNRILSGTVMIKSNIKEFTENGVIFEGENQVNEVDSVILATGYETYFSFLKDDIIIGKSNEVELYKYMFNPKLKHPETLAFIGLIQAFGPAIPISEVQARWHIQLLLGKCKPLPSVNKMMKDIKAKRKEIAERYFTGARHTMQVDWVPFMDEIASQFGAKPNLLKFFFSDPVFWFRLVFGPCMPYQYRLNGPHSWKGAKEALIKADDRVRAALETKKFENESQLQQKEIYSVSSFIQILFKHLFKFLNGRFYNNIFIYFILIALFLWVLSYFNFFNYLF